MIILPAIYLHHGKCVRLLHGGLSSAQVVSDDPVALALQFANQGAEWVHIVDLDGSVLGEPVHAAQVLELLQRVPVHVEVGGGIRDMEMVEAYLSAGVSQVILGSAALNDPEFVQEAVRSYGQKIIVSIDARFGKAAADGGSDQSEVDCIELARRVEQIGVQNIIFTDVSQHGGNEGPNFVLLDNLNQAVRCNIIANGGVSSLLDLIALHDLGLYGAVAGTALYSGVLDLRTALAACHQISKDKTQGLPDVIDRCFRKAELVPAVLQSGTTGQVLALKMMNREAMQRTLQTGEVWTYSRSRRSVWRKLTAESHPMTVQEIRVDCGSASFLITVSAEGAACHTGSASCFVTQVGLSHGNR